MRKVKCVSNNKSCMGYRNGQCISIENCGYKSPVLSNWEYLTDKENIRELAARLIEKDYEYETYQCSDGKVEEFLKDAIDNEVKWLMSERN